MQGTLTGRAWELAQLRNELSMLIDDERGGIDHTVRKQEIVREMRRLENEEELSK